MTGATVFGWSVGAAEPAGQWRESFVVEGIRVESREGEAGFDEHRASAIVCTDIDALVDIATDVSGFHEWVPYTNQARVLERSADRIVYYVQNSAPWPMKPRDMIYELVNTSVGGGEEYRITVTGLPDYLAPVDGAVRLLAARGEWTFRPRGPGDAGSRIEYWLYVNPGHLPALFVNRRVGKTVGQMVAHLAKTYPCSGP